MKPLIFRLTAIFCGLTLVTAISQIWASKFGIRESMRFQTAYMLGIQVICLIATVYYFKIGMFETISGGATKDDREMEKRGTEMNPGLEEEMETITENIKEEIKKIEEKNKTLERENGLIGNKIWQLQRKIGVIKGDLTNTKKKKSKKH
jgi:hypothetical protein